MNLLIPIKQNDPYVKYLIFIISLDDFKKMILVIFQIYEPLKNVIFTTLWYDIIFMTSKTTKLLQEYDFMNLWYKIT